MRADLVAGLYRKHSPDLIRFVQRGGTPRAQAEDIVHDAFVLLYRANAVGEDQATRVLYSLTRSVKSRHYRSEGRRHGRERRALGAEQATPDPADLVADSLHLDDLLGVLTPAEQTVMKLWLGADQTDSQIALHEKVSVNTVKTLRLRARRRLMAAVSSGTV